MSDIVIKVENLSKQYRLGQVGTGSLKHDLNRLWHIVRGKEDPYLKVGQVNDRSRKAESEFVWALKDINFEVKQGEVLGVIGKNGAGKSTLLKILSKITTPTTGEITIHGRIASLLEVGTGFHPELSGRENIFLNGAILGMRKAEVQAKFDEIVDFSGVAAYIDTPVKRYSSGMYVRLAFSVAAHLEPDILIVDEVLAVGDLDFQKKCLNRMNEVSKSQGRTILFVSHNLDAIRRICNVGLLIENGTISCADEIESCINILTESSSNLQSYKQWEPNDRKDIQFIEAEVIDSDYKSKELFFIDEEVRIRLRYRVKVNGVNFTHGFNLYDRNGLHILSSHDFDTYNENSKIQRGEYEVVVSLPGNMLSEGKFVIGLAIMKYNPFEVIIHEHECLSFSVLDRMDGTTVRGVYQGFFPGVIRPKLNWYFK